jgi:hypothetical protein
MAATSSNVGEEHGGHSKVVLESATTGRSSWFSKAAVYVIDSLSYGS